MGAINQYPPATQDLAIKRGQSLAMTFTFTLKSNGLPIDWTGWTMTCEIRKTASKTSALVKAMTATLNVPATDGKVNIALSSSDASAIEEGVYAYDVHAVSSSESRYLVEGKFIVEGRVTRT